MQEVAFSKTHILRPKKEIDVFSERSKSAAEPLISGHMLKSLAYLTPLMKSMDDI